LAEYFFVGGAPKSGTTWMQRSLDLHPEIICSGEGHFHEYIVKPVGDMLVNYNAKLNAVGQIVYQGDPTYPQLRQRDQIAIAREIITILMGHRTKPGARLIGDKTPANAFVIADLSVLFPAMKFINMLRDPRDAATSRLAHAARNGHPLAEDRSSEIYLKVVQGAAADWGLNVERTQAFAQRRPDQIAVVRYEELAADPAGELGRVFDFLGAETPPALLAEIVAASSFEAFSGGRTRGTESKTSFYRKGVAGDWRNHLSEQACELIARQLGPLAAQAGYDLSGG
jgi:hypothetical protein